MLPIAFHASADAKPLRSFAGIAPEHDAEKCERFSDDIMLSLYNVEQDSHFRPTRPKSSFSSRTLQ
ncbi:hypothetical protein C3Y89_08885, partial [Rhizobium sp. UPM1132]|nr:hypothetical protein [Rhizobium ruizarguesonis]